MGKRCGLATVLVLSGITRADDPRISEVGPDAVIGSVRELIEP
jgi:ribonucleotide monophosphatase NagD (HAD superfamily)